ncbi:hypothetical protein [Mesobacillus zeae]|uniref:hypothetical protein n=1 Tax=Mesobacillus zeae TaxID=1917180 RepID=UPI0015E7167B|nr:hypothetical protein [Mesobacillus zeae]
MSSLKRGTTKESFTISGGATETAEHSMVCNEELFFKSLLAAAEDSEKEQEEETDRK